MNLLGVHCSVAGGLVNAFREAESLGINTFQIFTKNQRQWKEKIVEEKESEIFRRELEQSNVEIAFSHTIYLINIASPDSALFDKSLGSLIAEVKRCTALGLDYTVLHPGSHPNKREGISNITRALQIVEKETAGSHVKVLLENTAGQGNSIGRSFAELADILSGTGTERFACCFDTCHAWAAGYAISKEGEMENIFKEFDRVVGLDHLKGIHLNDAKGPVGSRLDRHAHIGQGMLGLEPFTWIMNNFPRIPKVLETPKEENMDQVNLETLRRLVS